MPSDSRATQAQVLVAYNPTLGLRHDALVLARALRAAAPVNVFTLEIPWGAAPTAEIDLPDDLRQALPLDAVFFLEHVVPNRPFLDATFAKRRIYVPNPEWIVPSDRQAIAGGSLDGVFYKTPFTEAVFEDLPGAKQIPVRCVTGWSSVDIGESPPGDRDFETFLHVRGVSSQKQTEAVIEAWVANPDFPKLTVLVVMRDFELKIPLRAGSNVEVVVRRLPTTELRALQRRHGLHVCPSEAEGFGHSLNEALACGALLVTTDGPPMRDFVVPRETGFLVPVRDENIGRFNSSTSFRVTPEDIALTVRQVLDLPVEQRRCMGVAGRERFLATRKTFESNIGTLVGPAGRLALTTEWL